MRKDRSRLTQTAAGLALILGSGGAAVVVNNAEAAAASPSSAAQVVDLAQVSAARAAHRAVLAADHPASTKPTGPTPRAGALKQNEGPHGPDDTAPPPPGPSAA